jgi:hypothetical protein
MEHPLTLIAFDGNETYFDANTQINLDHTKLLLSIETPKESLGWHWDRFACLIRSSEHPAEQTTQARCEALLHLYYEQHKYITIASFHNIEMNLARNIMNIKEHKESAIINLDFLGWYRIHSTPQSPRNS